MKNDKFVSILAMVAISIFPAMFLYFRNVDKAYFYETLYPSGIFLGLAAAYFLLCLVFMRSFAKSAFAACLFIFVFTNYVFLENAANLVLFFVEAVQVWYIDPATRIWDLPPAAVVQVWHLAPLVLFLLLYINYLIKKRFSEGSGSKAVAAISVVFCGLILVNAVFAAPQLSAKMARQSTESSIVLNPNKNGGNDLYPNIYYFIFDEYASFDSIKKYYDYDNSAFAEFLEERGFTVSYNSSNLSLGLATEAIIANLMALEYRWLDFNWQQARASWVNNALFRLVESYGYDVLGIGGAPGYFGLSEKGPRRKSETVDGLDFAGVVLGNSMLGWFIKDERYLVYAKKVLEMQEHMRVLSPPLGNTFTFSYVVSPHSPFVFDQDGNIQKNLRNIAGDFTNPKGYRDQYIFITKLMREIVDILLEKDPGSVIIFQSDHGPRNLRDRITNEISIAFEDKYHILNAVYFKGEPLPEIQGLSGLNTLRIVLSKLFGANLPVLPVP